MVKVILQQKHPTRAKIGLKKGGALTRIKLPSNGDATDFRVTEPQQEGPVRLVNE